VAQPTWMRRVSPAATMSARRSICLGSRSSRPTTFAVPRGHIASRTRLPTRPCNASLIVPSPPDTITSPAPSRTASAANRVASFGPAVFRSSTSTPRALSRRQKRSMASRLLAALPRPAFGFANLRHPVHHIEVGLGVQMAEDLVGVIQHIDVSNLACGAGLRERFFQRLRRADVSCTCGGR